jgi:hypothetical protein
MLMTASISRQLVQLNQKLLQEARVFINRRAQVLPVLSLILDQAKVITNQAAQAVVKVHIRVLREQVLRAVHPQNPLLVRAVVVKVQVVIQDRVLLQDRLVQARVQDLHRVVAGARQVVHLQAGENDS